MKLLGWMRHKIKQTTTLQPFKEFKAGTYCCLLAQASYDGQNVHPKSYSGLRDNSSLPNQTYGNPKPHGNQEELEDEISIVNGESFHGFLAIGTLGTEPLVNESEHATPKLAPPQENVKEEMKKDDMKFIIAELEKFLESEAEEGHNQSARRSSHASIISLSGKPIKGTDSEENEETAVCPLEGYFLASSIEFSKPNNEVRKRKGSFSRLFQWRKVVDENSIEKYEKTEIQEDQTYQLERKYPIKKITKKLFASPRIIESAPSTEHDSVPMKKSLQKILRKKIHSEKPKAESKDQKLHKDNINNISSGRSYIGGDVIRQPQEDNGVVRRSSKTFLSQCEMEGTSANRKREKWIKTDAEYLVLEL